MFGYGRDELVGQPIEMLVPSRGRDGHRRHRAGYLKEPRARPMGSGLELYALRKDGREFPVEISLSPIETAEGLLVTSTVRDIGERKRLEAQARSAAVLEERNRLAREIHDSLTHSLTGVVLQLEAAEDVLAADPREAHQHLVTARDLARSGLDAVRRALQALRPSLLDEGDLPCAVRRTTQELVAHTGVNAAFSLRGRRQPLAREVEDDLVRIAQEAVTNAVRHADAAHVRTELVYEPGAVRLRIVDDGKGFETRAGAPAAGLGLAGMRERAQRIGAKLRLRTDRGKGTTVEVSVPMPHARRRKSRP